MQAKAFRLLEDAGQPPVAKPVQRPVTAESVRAPQEEADHGHRRHISKLFQHSLQTVEATRLVALPRWIPVAAPPDVDGKQPSNTASLFQCLTGQVQQSSHFGAGQGTALCAQQFIPALQPTQARAGQWVGFRKKYNCFSRNQDS